MKVTIEITIDEWIALAAVIDRSDDGKCGFDARVMGQHHLAQSILNRLSRAIDREEEADENRKSSLS